MYGQINGTYDLNGQSHEPHKVANDCGGGGGSSFQNTASYSVLTTSFVFTCCLIAAGFGIKMSWLRH